MRVLVLGSNGMAGHMVANYLNHMTAHDLVHAARSQANPDLAFDARDSTSVGRLLSFVEPDVVVNCVGVLVHAANDNPRLAAEVNSVFPHLLADKGRLLGFRLIHLSSDCVFSGRHGPYIETDLADATDHYGKSKALGEVCASNEVTIRTSIIGPEIGEHRTGLYEWFLAQRGTVRGYSRAIWSGVTTLQLSKAVRALIDDPDVFGLIHLTNGKGISKYHLLCLMRDIWGRRDVEIVPDAVVHCNKSIVSTRTDWQPQVPGYEAMLRELFEWMHMSHKGQ